MMIYDDEPSKGEEGYEGRRGGDEEVAKQKNLKPPFGSI